MIDLNLNPSKRELRTFGFGTLAFLAFIGWIVWRRSGSIYAAGGVVAVGMLVALLGIVVPNAIRPLFIALNVVSYPMAWGSSHVLMALIFYLVVTPLAVIMKLSGRDPMERRFDSSVQSYWKRRSDKFDSRRYFRQF